MKRHPESHHSIGLRLLLLGGAVAVIAGLTLDAQKMLALNQIRRPENCVGQINPNAMVSRDQLAMFLTVPERDAKAKVKDILQASYCELPGLEVRAGVPAERSVYRLAFDPQTWLVVLYEGDEYAGYQFQVRR
jgi:hypothetical protein